MPVDCAPVGEKRTDSPLGDEDQPQRRRTDQPPDDVAVPPRRGAWAWIATHRIATFLLAAALLAAAAAGVAWWLNARDYESTDDAFIDARPSAISAEVPGSIVEVAVTDNEIVAPGQTLVRLDDRNYRAAQAQAKAQVAQAAAAIQIGRRAVRRAAGDNRSDVAASDPG